MRRAGVLAMVALALGTHAAAQPPSAEDTARALYRLSMATGATDVMVKQMSGLLANVLADKLSEGSGIALSPAELDQVHQAVSRVLSEMLGGRALEDAAVAIYLRHFNVDELGDLLRFYQTPIGAKSLRLAGTVSAELAAVGERIGQSPEFQRRMLEELRKALPDRFRKEDSRG